MALLVELPFNDDIALGATCKSSGFVLIRREYFSNEVIKVGYQLGIGSALAS
jgi:hypothetical protein